jgi:hypothetical protein
MPDGEELDPANMFSGSRLTQLTGRSIEHQKFDSEKFSQKYAEIRSAVELAALDGGATIIDPLKYLLAVTDLLSITIQNTCVHLTRAKAPDTLIPRSSLTDDQFAIL